MTATHQATPTPPAPYVPAWMLHVYHGVAHICWNGRLVAKATCTTPAEEARMVAFLDRLTAHTSTD